MRFCQQQIQLAIEFKRLDLAWEPAVGHYVYDADHCVEPSSPFQPRVYFLLNYDCFMRKVGGVDRFKEIMTWLPTWSHARDILRSLGVPDREVSLELTRRESLEGGTELLDLYGMIAVALRRTQSDGYPVSSPAAHPPASRRRPT